MKDYVNFYKITNKITNNNEVIKTRKNEFEHFSN